MGRVLRSYPTDTYFWGKVMRSYPIYPTERERERTPWLVVASSFFFPICEVPPLLFFYFAAGCYGPHGHRVNCAANTHVLITETLRRRQTKNSPLQYSTLYPKLSSLLKIIPHLEPEVERPQERKRLSESKQRQTSRGARLLYPKA